MTQAAGGAQRLRARFTGDVGPPTGVIGDPTAASAELGRKLWAALVDEAALLFRDAALGPL